ncbi:GNAT family N-acetyltransferase [Rossellomorea aquimaris]|uniref:GNAT family N-acetyltransferase n=1 Tax=Rossellomorea aquimaris TaxID=189382 RepID=UPI0007D090F9|nr:GNAT family N-acetyltransferase [Rossellomorea aquimaris]
MEPYKLTNKVKTLIQHAESRAKSSNRESVGSLDLFLGAALVKEGTLLEMYHLIEPYKDQLESIYEDTPCEKSSLERIVPFTMSLSTKAMRIWKTSVEVMRRYNQTFLNEGHIIKAFYTHLHENPQLKYELKGLPHEEIIQCATTARDLIVNVVKKDWSYSIDSSILIKQVQHHDQNALTQFVETHFGKLWSKTLLNGFHPSHQKIPLVMASENDEIIGFAAFDVFQNKKGIYGPMGVVPTTRHKGVGKGLLYTALQKMKEKGYMYALLKEAGPIEFYEKTCEARLIPLEKKR